MSEEEMSEAELVERDVDEDPAAHNATEDDEEAVLRGLYGERIRGLYLGEGA
ncbi:hypothetical protein [Actinomadura rugatobispora]|uniref:Uncharacterized protein n=1 Tax=Actinomadura rugatobispora TaxID=1994 RepID=A0ABW0ZVL3_9ACTN|nr:hypothetical protein GCM10010200_036620 [Actinomadura rugatobispora]